MKIQICAPSGIAGESVVADLVMMLSVLHKQLNNKKKNVMHAHCIVFTNISLPNRECVPRPRRGTVSLCTWCKTPLGDLKREILPHDCNCTCN